MKRETGALNGHLETLAIGQLQLEEGVLLDKSRYLGTGTGQQV